MRYISIIVVLFIITSCSTDYSEYGMKRNLLRIEDNLEIIKSDWIFEGESLGNLTWVDPYLEQKISNGKSFYGKKKIGINNIGEVLYERDYYYSGKKVVINKGGPDEILTNELVMITRYYDQGYISKWGYWSVDVKSGFETMDKVNPSIIEAEELLKSWGLERFSE